jgi:chorismate dehydratase
MRNLFEVIPSSPARCADQLSSGEVEIGLIPSIEYARIPSLRILPGMAIASLAEVRSILLVRPRDKQSIRSVALDTTSRTSVVLTKLLLEDIMGIQPEFVPHSPDLDSMLKRCDAALLIGDAALGVNLEDYHSVDLGKMWFEWQKKPFVFAFWACRSDVSVSDDLVETFQLAKEWGLKKRSEIASVYSEKLSLPREFLEHYLLYNINYELGPDHILGLQAYYRLAVERGHILEAKPLNFLHT